MWQLLQCPAADIPQFVAFVLHIVFVVFVVVYVYFSAEM